jgi:mono/diheme cytochrome c family protein
MNVIGRFLRFLIVAAIGAVVAAAVLLFVVMPRMQWDATAAPSAGEARVARYVLGRWVRTNAPSEQNPLPPTADNLREGEHEYDEHCAVCHGLDGSGENRVGGDFHPPIPRLNKGVMFLSDGQFYFILSNGIRLTGMPGFGPRHSPEELWKIILWVRHFPNLTAQERATLQARSKAEEGGEAEH